MGAFDNLYSAYDQVKSQPVLPTELPQPTQTTAAHPLTALIASLLAPQTQPAKPAMDFGALINALRRVPHLGIGGREMTTSNPTGDPRDPWNNPAFFANNPIHLAALASQDRPLY